MVEAEVECYFGCWNYSDPTFRCSCHAGDGVDLHQTPAPENRFVHSHAAAPPVRCFDLVEAVETSAAVRVSKLKKSGRGLAATVPFSEFHSFEDPAGIWRQGAELDLPCQP